MDHRLFLFLNGNFLKFKLLRNREINKNVMKNSNITTYQPEI